MPDIIKASVSYCYGSVDEKVRLVFPLSNRRSNLLSSYDKLKNVVVFTHAAGNSTVGPNARWARFAEGLATRGVSITIVGSSFFTNIEV